MGNEKLVTKLNEALGWELRAVNMYAHYAANIRGTHRIQLAPLFKSEVDESMIHAETVRNAIVKNDGIAVTERNPETILHTTDYTVMIHESLKTEMKAAEVYGELMQMLEDMGDGEIYDAIEQIYLSEVRSIEEMRLLMS